MAQPAEPKFKAMGLRVYEDLTPGAKEAMK